VWNLTRASHGGIGNVLRDHDLRGNYGNGTVFKLFQSRGVWKLKIIHSFDGADGYEPWGR